jgi:hypothetical protein
MVTAPKPIREPKAPGATVERFREGEPRTDGKFTKGNGGKPRGARHKGLIALDAIGQEGAEAVIRKLRRMATTGKGDARAAEILLRRFWPEQNGRTVPTKMPRVTNGAEAVKAITHVLKEVADGELSLEEGQGYVIMLEAAKRGFDDSAYEEKVRQLEEAQRLRESDNPP